MAKSVPGPTGIEKMASSFNAHIFSIVRIMNVDHFAFEFKATTKRTAKQATSYILESGTAGQASQYMQYY
jgi:uncharacterized membrane protein